MSTPTQDHYLEAIWVLTHQKGYARVTDLADHLAITPTSVSHMVRRLHQSGFLTYERYRGFAFTPQGRRQAHHLYRRRQTVQRFLTHLHLGTESEVETMAVAIAHALDTPSMAPIARLVAYIEANPDWWQQFAADDVSPAPQTPDDTQDPIGAQELWT